jgi:UDP-galactopyranose mutase
MRQHLHPERRYAPGKTLIYREYSRFATRADEPYYPINTAQDKQVLAGYQELARTKPNVIFGGRLGSYQYLDMHQAVAAALTTYNNRLLPLLHRPLARAA